MRRALAIGAALAAAYALKRFYSSASADDFRFILWPTAKLVSLSTGTSFDDTPAGFVSHEARFVIAPACAGVNFLILSFVALVLARPSPAWLVPNALCAYAAALLANVARIALALAVPLGPAQHRVEGIVVYLVMLGALFAAVGARHKWRVALACYLAFTIAVPLLHGGWARRAFWEHALVVALVAAITACCRPSK